MGNYVRHDEGERVEDILARLKGVIVLIKYKHDLK